ncbi:MAG: hypothetical protein IJA63_09145 [Akkermansia sp.]|nr:hypothetical protein [Akkermansia sp.]
MTKIGANMLGAGIVIGLLGDFCGVGAFIALGALLAVPGAILLALCNMGK